MLLLRPRSKPPGDVEGKGPVLRPVLPDVRRQPLREASSGLPVFVFWQKGGKLISPDAGDDVALPDAFQQNLRRGPEESVSGLVPQGVVHQLESVHVAHQPP